MSLGTLCSGGPPSQQRCEGVGRQYRVKEPALCLVAIAATEEGELFRFKP